VTLRVGGSEHPAASAVDHEGVLRAVLQSADTRIRTAFQLRPEPSDGEQRALMVGLHGDRGVLWWSDPARGESLVAVGGRNVEDVLYYIGTADFEFPPRSELPRGDVLAAAVEFLATGCRPTAPIWLDSEEAFVHGRPASGE
jgi:hypothetical protein